VANHNSSETYPLTFEALRQRVPNASGVYAIQTARKWVYIGESDDIQQSLFRHLNEPSAAMNRFGALSFSFELVPASERVARQHALMSQLEPACSTEELDAEAHRAS